MKSTLDQLYATKLQLIAVLAVVLGVALLLLAHWSDTAGNLVPGWLAALPLAEIGSTIFSTGLLAVFFEYVDRKHGDQRADERVRAAVRREAPAIRDAVLDSFAFDTNTLKSVASDETLDRIATNALGLRVHDQALATDLYADVRDQVVQATERWHDVRVSLSLTPWGAGPVSGHGSMFVATIRWEYRVRPASSTLRFACVADLSEYREMLRDQAVTSAWYVGRSSGLDASDPEVFQLVSFTVDGKDRKIRRTQRAVAQIYAVSLGADADDEVTLAYTYRTLVQRHGHLLYLDLPRPTKGLHVQLDYTGAGIRRVNTLDYFASSRQARVDEAARTADAKTVNISFDGWVFPRSGVAFVWVLEEELATPS
ncbi:hypothetical protein [Saccharothrix texasensis]|uniref:Uncharacterized protein n=1 Tax=Saccharothrix texasensis TaxID=103734 RepID=A0A3N1H8Y2_9PSEU|nr:hypothetical protein [Saccharothrix texasensis]ROP38973.1 hypothetical protein EDD40_4341 [Saccharothrix texasensis]